MTTARTKLDKNQPFELIVDVPVKIYMSIPISPISINKWKMPIRMGRSARVIVTPEGRQFTKDVQRHLERDPIKGDLGMWMGFYVKNARMDLDNPVKPFKDALEGFVYENDNQVKASCEWIRVDKENPRIEFAVWRLE